MTKKLKVRTVKGSRRGSIRELGTRLPLPAQLAIEVLSSIFDIKVRIQEQPEGQRLGRWDLPGLNNSWFVVISIHAVGRCLLLAYIELC